jgi:hypothetical protein
VQVGGVGWGCSGGRSGQAVAADLGRRWRQIWAGVVDERVRGRGIREQVCAELNPLTSIGPPPADGRYLNLCRPYHRTTKVTSSGQ